MNEQDLSKRLALVGAQVPQGARLADIGSDHAYLPVVLMLSGQISYGVAGEVVKGPFTSASNQVAKNQLEDKIMVRLADGLAAIHEEDRIDTITIAGMGGALIADILAKGKKNGHLQGSERLVLQPNVGEATLRLWLMENHYQITHEEILEEHQKIYEIIVADPLPKEEASQGYSQQELLFGPYLMKEKSAVYQKKWQKEIQSRQYVLQQLKNAEKIPTGKVSQLMTEIAWIKEQLAD